MFWVPEQTVSIGTVRSSTLLIGRGIDASCLPFVARTKRLFRTQSKESSGGFPEALPELSARKWPLFSGYGLPVRRPGAGMTTEAIACGTPVVFDLSRDDTQESNNLNTEKTGYDVVSTCRPSRCRNSCRAGFLHSSQNGKKPDRFLMRSRDWCEDE